MDIELGGSITLKGFSDIGGGELVVAKKIIGSYARKISENIDDYENLTLDLKKKNPYVLSAEVTAKKSAKAEVKDKNLFVAIDLVLKEVIKKLD